MSKYRHLTDNEFLQAVSTQAMYSPILKELALRLAARCDADVIEECGNKTVDCPICEAVLHVSVDYIDEVYCLEAQ